MLRSSSKSGDMVIEFVDEMLGMSVHSILEMLPEKVKVARSVASATGKKELNVIGRLAGNLAKQGRHDERVKVEDFWHRTLSRSARADMPITLLCSYDSMPVKLRGPLQLTHNRPLITGHQSTIMRLRLQSGIKEAR